MLRTGFCGSGMVWGLGFRGKYVHQDNMGYLGLKKR